MDINISNATRFFKKYRGKQLDKGSLVFKDNMIVYKYTKKILFYLFKQMKIILMFSLFLVHLSQQNNEKPEESHKYSNAYSGPDYSQEIKDTIKRYSRETNQPIGEIRQKLFARRSVMNSVDSIKGSNKYK